MKRNFSKQVLLAVLFCLTNFLSFGSDFIVEEYSGSASVYAIARYGKKMANGDYLSSRHKTCSHEFLPMGSLIEVTNLANSRSVVVEVNGKSQTTSLELTHSIAQEIGMTSTSRNEVKIIVLRRGDENGVIISPSVSYSSNSVQSTVVSSSVYNPMPAPERSKRKGPATNNPEALYNAGNAGISQPAPPPIPRTTYTTYSSQPVVVSQPQVVTQTQQYVPPTQAAPPQKKYEFPNEFPQHTPMKLDTVNGKVIIRN
jgi:rare lipoprotein A